MNRYFITLFLFLISQSICQDVKWPTSASHFYSSNFGENRDDHFHMGLDIKTNGITGYEVVAVEDGYIHRLVSNYNGYGKALYQMTVSGHEALYAHLESFTPILEKVWHMQQTRRRSYKVDAHFSRREFQVKKGDVIGYTGNTGNSFGPHLHFEYRSSKSEPLNPLTMAFDIPDHVTPIPKKLALIPLSQGSMVNASSLVQTIPLYRDRAGVYHFADTLSVFGDFAFAIQAVDKREGGNNSYQFQKAELLIDGRKQFELDYTKIPFSNGYAAKTMIQFDLKRQNLGEYQKLYRLEEHPKTSIHSSKETGIIRMAPGFHSVEINIYDASGNKAVVRGMIAGTFPMTLGAEEILRDDKVITLALSPKRGGLPIRDAIIYSFTPYGYADQKVEILHAQQVKKDLHITLPLKSINNRILQIIGINQLGGMVDPFHWTSMIQKTSVLDIRPDLKISNTERGIFFQVDLNQFVPIRCTIKLANDNTFQSYPLVQIQPNTYLSELMSHHSVKDIKYVDVELLHEGITRETRFHFNPKTSGPGQETVVLSNDKNCSIQILSNTFYQTNVVWIDRVKEFAPVNEGFHLSPVYQLQPYNIALRDTFKVGIRYDRDLADHSNLGIYYYNGKDEEWVYTPTNNNRRKQILTATLNQMDAITVIQDLDSPLIKSTFPADGGRYQLQDVNQIIISVDDLISGIESEEASFDLMLNGNQVFPAYQPIKKEISYLIEQPLSEGQHQIDFKVRDRMGNESTEIIYFSVY